MKANAANNIIAVEAINGGEGGFRISYQSGQVRTYKKIPKTALEWLAAQAAEDVEAEEMEQAGEPEQVIPIGGLGEEPEQVEGAPVTIFYENEVRFSDEEEPEGTEQEDAQDQAAEEQEPEAEGQEPEQEAEEQADDAQYQEQEGDEVRTEEEPEEAQEEPEQAGEEEQEAEPEEEEAEEPGSLIEDVSPEEWEAIAPEAEEPEWTEPEDGEPEEEESPGKCWRARCWGFFKKAMAVAFDATKAAILWIVAAVIHYTPILWELARSKAREAAPYVRAAAWTAYGTAYDVASWLIPRAWELAKTVAIVAVGYGLYLYDAYAR